MVDEPGAPSAWITSSTIDLTAGPIAKVVPFFRLDQVGGGDGTEAGVASSTGPTR